MTPAIELLRRRGIDHECVTYEHRDDARSYGLEAAESLDLDPSIVFKTLLATVDGDRTVVALVPVDRKLHLKSLARAAGGRKAAMTDPARAERLTGYVVGGISPLGQRTRLRTFIDDSASGLPQIYVSGGRRGLDVRIAPSDLADVVDASFRKLAEDG